MSGSKPTVAIRLGIEGADKVRRELEALGKDGEKALKQFESALAKSNPEMQKLAGSADIASRAFAGMGGSLGRVGSVATGVAGVAGVLTTGFVALGAAAAVSAVAIAKAGDSANATLARLTSASGGIGQAQTAYEGLYKLSQQTGVSVTESAAAFSRFAVAAKEVGATNDQVLRLVGGLQKAAIAVGTTGQEAAAGMQQLAQALASGVLQGDELRSLIENMPQLAAELAREFGVGLGQLKKMGEEGRLTADQVLPKLLSAAERLSGEFDKMPKTMAQAASILGNATDDLLIKLDRAANISARFRNYMLDAAKIVNTIGSAVAPTDSESAQSGAAAARAEIAKRERAIAILREERGTRQASAFMPGVDARRYDRTLAEEQAGLVKAQEALKQHEAMLRLIENDGRRQRGEDAAEAEVRRQATARTQATAKRTELEKEYKTEAGVREAFSKKFAELEKLERDAVDPADIARLGALRVAMLKDQKEALEKLGDTHKAVGAAAKDADEHVQAYYKAQDKAAAEAAKQVEKAAEEQQKYYERSWDQFASIGERAADRVADALVQAFVTGEGKAVNFGNIMRGVMASVVADFAKLAVINPVLNSVFTASSGARPTLAAAFGGTSTGGGGIGDLLGLGQMLGGKSVFESIGLTGSSGILSTPLWSTGGTTMGPLAEVVGGSTTSLGSLLGGAGAGFGAGMLVNNLLGGKSTGGMVGSGVGGLAGAAIGSIIPGVGTLIGGLLGGGLGGGLGGLVGPGESVKGYGYQLTPANDGLLQMSSQFYNESGKAAFDEAAAGIAQLNQYLGARGLNVQGAVAVGGNKDGADYSNASAGSFTEGLRQLQYGSSNAALDYAMANSRGRSFGSTAELQTFVEGFYSIQDAITAMSAETVPPFITNLKAINDNFSAAAAKASEYGLAVGEVTEAQTKAVAELFAARAETLRQSDTNLEIRRLSAAGDAQGAELARQAEAARLEVTSFGDALEALGLTAAEKAARLVALEEVQAAERAAIITRFGAQASSALAAALNPGTGLLRELTYGGGSALSPSAKYFAAMTDLNSAKQALDAGGSLSNYTQVASAVLPVARDFLGTSSRYAGLAAEVGQVLQANGGDGSLSAILSAQANTSDAQLNLTADIGSRTISELVSIRQAFERLATSVDAIISRKAAA